MDETRFDDALTARLRAGDPAGGDPGLGPVERAAMRRRLLDASRVGRRRASGWLLPAAVAMALLALALGLALRQPRGPDPRVAAGAEPPPAATSAGRQVQFTTDNGTLVVWVLQPRLAG